MDGFQTHLTGLTTDEARCLFLVGQPQVAHRARVTARPPAPRATSSWARSRPRSPRKPTASRTWYLNDPDPWTGHHVPHGELRRLARSIQRRRRVEVVIGHEPAVTVQPLGLVLKAGSWNLVVLGDAAVDVVALDDLRATRLTNQRFTPPPGFDLARFWEQWARPRAAARSGLR